MRVVLAGLTVFAGLLATVAVLETTGLMRLGTWVVVPLALVAFVALIGGSLVFFNSRADPAPLVDRYAAEVADLEARGLIVVERFEARRAFEVEEFEDEGCHFFLELRDGRVLFLSGQYLYDYVGSGEEGLGRQFPSTAFAVRRHRTERYVVGLDCHGTVLAPDATAPPFGLAVWTRDAVPADGTVITDRSYDDIRAERLQSAG